MNSIKQIVTLLCKKNESWLIPLYGGNGSQKVKHIQRGRNILPGTHSLAVESTSCSSLDQSMIRTTVK